MLLLSDTFINNLSGLITPDILVEKLSGYPHMGKIMYIRHRSSKAPAMKFVNVTVLQLIASKLTWLDIDKENKCYCRVKYD